MLAIMAMLTASKGLIVPPLDAIEGFPKVTFAVSLRPIPSVIIPARSGIHVRFLTRTRTQQYSGDVMVPFEGQLHVAMPELAAWTEQTLAR